MRTVIVFDVSADKRRYRVVKELLERCERVQKSVFEVAELNEAGYLRLRSRVERNVDPSTDSLRYYRLCAACSRRVEHFGTGPGILDVPEDFVIIGD